MVPCPPRSLRANRRPLQHCSPPLLVPITPPPQPRARAAAQRVPAMTAALHEATGIAAASARIGTL